LAEELLLADEFLQRPRPHARRQRLRLFKVLLVSLTKKFDGNLQAGARSPHDHPQFIKKTYFLLQAGANSA
jgi:hypothetical protein